MEIAFTKMNGLGNDFVVIDGRRHALTLTPSLVRQLADRNNPDTRGCDQLLHILPPRGNGTVFMDIFNADGSRVGACGNGTRAVAMLLGLSDCIIETEAGALACQLSDDNLVTVNMGPPRLSAAEIPVSNLRIDPRAVQLHDDLPLAILVNMGNPHAVMFTTEAPQSLALRYGPALEHHPLFPERANINFYRLHKPDHLEMATWERGAGLTKACGTGACATAVAHALAQGFAPETFRRLDVPGGTLHIRSDAETAPVWMRGPAAIEFTGHTHVDLTEAPYG
jgi:diaminopimelate epimerase